VLGGIFNALLGGNFKAMPGSQKMLPGFQKRSTQAEGHLWVTGNSRVITQQVEGRNVLITQSKATWMMLVSQTCLVGFRFWK